MWCFLLKLLLPLFLLCWTVGRWSRPLGAATCCSARSTNDDTGEAGTAFPSGAPEFTPGFSAVRVFFLVLCICFADRCLSFFTFLWPLCCLFIDSDFPFGIFKLFFLQVPCCEPCSYNLVVQDSDVELLSTTCSWHVQREQMKLMYHTKNEAIH